jgi:hypothetical protein
LNPYTAAGLALDIAGAAILASSLLARPSVLMLRASTFWGGFSAPVAVSGAEGRADAEAGVIGLALGFTGQFVGQADTSAHAPLGLGLILAAGSALVAAAGWRVWRAQRRRALMVSIARCSFENNGRVVALDKPRSSRLLAMAKAMDERPAPAEDESALFTRVFGVDEVIEDHEPSECLAAEEWGTG